MSRRLTFQPEWNTDLNLNRIQRSNSIVALSDDNRIPETSLLLKSARLNAGLHCISGNSAFFETRIDKFAEHDPDYPLPNETLKSVIRVGWQTSSSILVAGQDAQSFAFDIPSLRFLTKSVFKRFDRYDDSLVPPSEVIIPTDHTDDSEMKDDLNLRFDGVGYVYSSVSMVSHDFLEFTFILTKSRLIDYPSVQVPQLFKVMIAKPSDVQVLYPVVTLRNSNLVIDILPDTNENFLQSLNTDPSLDIHKFMFSKIEPVGVCDPRKLVISRPIGYQPTVVFLLGTRKDTIDMYEWVRWYKNEYHQDEFYHIKNYTHGQHRQSLFYNCDHRKASGLDREMHVNVQDILMRADMDFVQLFEQTAPMHRRNYLIEAPTKEQIGQMTKDFKDRGFDVST